MTVGAGIVPLVARISPIASGCPSQSTSSASPPADRMKSQTHSPARRTSPAWALSALTEGIRRNPASSSNQGSLMAASLVTQPCNDVGGIAVGREHRIEDLLDHPGARDERQSLVEREPGDLERR